MDKLISTLYRYTDKIKHVAVAELANEIQVKLQALRARDCSSIQ